ncbi:hypothetical protein BOX15_Mlig032625g1, partial [Macrostomum lignano]
QIYATNLAKIQKSTLRERPESQFAAIEYDMKKSITMKERQRSREEQTILGLSMLGDNTSVASDSFICDGWKTKLFRRCRRLHNSVMQVSFLQSAWLANIAKTVRVSTCRQERSMSITELAYAGVVGANVVFDAETSASIANKLDDGGAAEDNRAGADDTAKQSSDNAAQSQ